MRSAAAAAADMDIQQQPQSQQSQQPARRRNSTYLALACANAVSQGAMTRSLRQMFESAPIQQTQPPLLSRDEIKQAIANAKLRRNSIAFQPDTAAAGRQTPDPSAPFSTTVMAVPAIVVPAPPSSSSTSPPPTPPKPNVVQAQQQLLQLHQQQQQQQQQQTCFRCDKCSSILPSPPPPMTTTTAATPVPLPSSGETQEDDKAPGGVGVGGGKLANVPTNREVNEDELPKPDTVKNARCLFESNLMMTGDGGFSGFSTLQHVKSNPASRIVRSESTMTLDRAGSRAPSSRFRWPCNQLLARSPSPSPAPSPLPTAPFGLLPAAKSKTPVTMGPTGPTSYYRSTPSLTQYGTGVGGTGVGVVHQRASRFQQQQQQHQHQPDAESCISEAGSDCWSSSDLDSEASCYSASSSAASASGRESSDPLNCTMDGMRYVSPQVMDKIRSYGMTLTFVNGKMVDEDELDEALAKQNERNAINNTKHANEAATSSRQVSQKPIHSAGQSRSTNQNINKPQLNNNNNKPQTAVLAAVAATAAAANNNNINVNKTINDKRQSPQPRIVACVPKPADPSGQFKKHRTSLEQAPHVTYSPTKVRHSSGESSASSGVSSGNDNGSEHNSPFATLKRTKSSEADHTIERSPSPGPRQSGATKSLGSSPFGCYSVVYSFDKSSSVQQLQQQQQQHRNTRPMYV